ncbi:MAG: SURF1 family protein [Gammaproteobacteria bacterium]|nr:SURF1 family protein [Gammaproteobacteria bacterium]
MGLSRSIRKYGLVWLLPAVLLAAGFVRLGFWQLDRAEQKRDIQQQIDAAGTLALDEVSATSAAYSKVAGSGEYLPLPLLLDNQVQDGRQGVHVLSPLRLDGGRLLLVNRGWLPLAADRRALPAVATPEGEVAIRGRLAPLPGVGMRLGTQPALAPQQWPQLITYVDAQLLQQGFRTLLQQPDLQLLPQILKLDADAAHGFAGRDWALINFGPNKHTAYALQWFTLAATVLATFVILSLRSARRR